MNVLPELIPIFVFVNILVKSFIFFQGFIHFFMQIFIFILNFWY